MGDPEIITTTLNGSTDTELVLVIHALLARLGVDSVELSNDELMRAADRHRSHELFTVRDQSRLCVPVRLMSWPRFTRNGGSHG